MQNFNSSPARDGAAWLRFVPRIRVRKEGGKKTGLYWETEEGPTEHK